MALIVHTLHLGPLDNNTYVVACDETRAAAVIDVGFDPEVAIRFVRDQRLTARLLLNTHAHYDHLAGMRAVQEALGGEYWLHPGDRPLLVRPRSRARRSGSRPPSRPSTYTISPTGRRSRSAGRRSR